MLLLRRCKELRGFRQSGFLVLWTFCPHFFAGLLAATWVWSSPAATPVAWWKFDDTGNPGLDSIGGYNATPVGYPLPGLAAGYSGMAVSLNGSGQYLQAADTPGLELTGPMTITVWAKANAINANYSFVYKASAWDDGQMAYMLDLDWFSGGKYPRFAVSSDGHASGYKIVVSPVAMDTTSWHFIAGVYDGSYIRIYVDGQLQASTAYSAGIYAGHDPLYIGWDWNNTWNGLLDEVQIFNGALTSAEILSMYQAGLPPLGVNLSGNFGRLEIGEAKTNQVVFSNAGTNALTVTPLVTGPDASRFQLLSPAGTFLLQPGAGNYVTGAVCFVPDSARGFNASLTVTSSANSVQIPLTGQGVGGRMLTLNLQTRDPASGQVIHTTQTLSSSRLAILAIDVWDSHHDPEMASRGAALIPRMNQTMDAARSLGIAIFFCPNEVPLPPGADRSVFAALPNQPQIDNGFNPPLAPYTGSSWGDMVPIPYDLAHGTRFAGWTSQHPDLVVKPGDLGSVSRQEIFNYCVANGIDHLLYVGAAANMCISYTREISMIPMKRYCGMEVISIRDLTDSMTLNGRIATGNNDNLSNINMAMTPDFGHRQVTASNETFVCSTIDARQLMQYWPSALYSDLVTGQTNLIDYWRMDSKAAYQEILDVNRLQSCWWNRNDANQMAGLAFGVAGAITNDPDTAVQFAGSSTLLLCPIYRVDIPTNIPIAGLSATSFTLELWVRIDQLTGSNQWFYAHDGGTSGTVDVLLGLNSSNQFEFVVGRNTIGTDWGDVVVSSNAVTQADVDAHHWFHLVAEHDLVHSNALLFVDAAAPAIAVHNCGPVTLAYPPHLGSRGVVQMGNDGNLSNRGFEGLSGALDEVAIYSSILDARTVAAHYAAAQGISPAPQFTSAVPTPGGLALSFSGGIGKSYVIQGSTNLLNWDPISTNTAPADGLQILDPMSAGVPARFYRAMELP